MSASLRITLIVCSVFMLIYIGYKIRSEGMRIRDGILWLLAAVAFIIISIWPEIIYRICERFGIVSPTNLVYLMVIAYLLLVVFYNAVRISRLEARIDHLVQEVALRDDRFIGIETEDQRILKDES